MMKRLLPVWFCLLFRMSLNTTSFDTAKCSYSFVFPTLDHFELTAEENTNISLPFSFDTSCSLPHIFSITVARNEKDSKETKLPIQKDVCNIRLINSKCHVSHLKNNCSCGSHEDMFRFTRTVTRADIGSWIWRTTSGIAEEREVVFNITYPPQVMSLKLEPEQIQDENQSVNITCLWENGNPPVTARLLDRHGVEMEGSIYSSGQIRYRFPAVGCQDAGLIRCEAPGASRNKTATLLVKCPPNFVGVKNTTISIYNGQDFVLPIRTHTAELESCTMKKRLSNLKIEMEIQHSRCYMTGTPPDLTLTVRLDNVRKEEEGQWRLELTNDAGTGHAHVLLTDKVTTSTEPATVTLGRTTSSTKDSLHVYHELSSTRVDFTVFGSVVVAAIAVTVITISVIRHKKGGRVNETARDTNHAERREPMNMEIQEPLQHQPEPGTESSQSNQSVHSYFEIPDETPPSSPEPPRRCLRPALPDDYLHPSVSTDIAEGTDDAKNVAPLYENTELRSISHNTGGAAACKSSPQEC